MIPAEIQEFFQTNQDLLWLTTVLLDLAVTVLMYRIFGRQGLLACILLAILLSNLQGPN